MCPLMTGTEFPVMTAATPLLAMIATTVNPVTEIIVHNVRLIVKCVTPRCASVVRMNVLRVMNQFAADVPQHAKNARKRFVRIV